MSRKVKVWRADIDNVSIDEALRCIDQMILNGGSNLVVTPNVDHLVRLDKSEEFREIYRNASLVLADGMPIMWSAWLLGTPLKEKVSGSDLFVRYCEHASQTGTKLFFLGGEKGAADEAMRRLVKLYPGLNVVGTLCPPYGFDADGTQLANIARAVRDANPDVVFVGLGSPKQEKWLSDWLAETGAPVGIGVGVSFSFVAERVKRAPRLLQRLGLEWMWRLCSEPKRLWRRYLIDSLPFSKYFLKLIFTRLANRL